jgi:ABC-type multidrug transport system fused ATPase/permease subunit
MYAAMLAAEAARTAQEIHGVADITPAMMRDGMEALEIDQALRWKSWACPASARNSRCPAPITAAPAWRSCSSGTAQQWVTITDFIAPDDSVTGSADRGGLGPTPPRTTSPASATRADLTSGGGATSPPEIAYFRKDEGRGRCTLILTRRERPEMLDQPTETHGEGVAPEFREAETLLEVNNIEVIYNHVILVLKGVSLKVPKGGITALLGGNGAGKTTTLKAISNLLHSERGEVTKGSIPIAASPCGPEPVGPCRPGRDPGDGGAPLFRAPDGRGEPPDRELHAQGRARRRSMRTSSWSIPISRG